MSDKILQVLAAIFVLTMPWWAGYALNLDRNGPLIEQVDK